MFYCFLYISYAFIRCLCTFFYAITLRCLRDHGPPPFPLPLCPRSAFYSTKLLNQVTRCLSLLLLLSVCPVKVKFATLSVLIQILIKYFNSLLLILSFFSYFFLKISCFLLFWASRILTIFSVSLQVSALSVRKLFNFHWNMANYSSLHLKLYENSKRKL